MPTRYCCVRPTDELVSELNAEPMEETLVAGRYNVGPLETVRVVGLRRSGTRVIAAAQWGLRTKGEDDPALGRRRVHVRGVGVWNSSTYGSMKARVLVPVDGWFEWQRVAGPNGRAKLVPHYITPRDGSLLVAAGVFSWSADSAGSPLLTCAILTMAAIGPLRAIHEEMPVLLPPDVWSTWLEPNPLTVHTKVVRGLASPSLTLLVQGLELRRVGNAVRSAANNGPHLLEPAPAPAV
jgi:putative SOS response-associated peptidase YedK